MASLLPDLRTVRLVATLAGFRPGVVTNYNLRKPLRLGGIGGVAARAKGDGVGQYRLALREVIRVRSLRPMAGLATEAGVLSALEFFELVLVAHLARRPSGEADGTGAHVIQSACAEMAVLPEPGRNKGLANKEKDREPGRKEDRQADQMARVFHASLPWAGSLGNSDTNRI